MAIIGAFMVPHPPLIISEIGGGQEEGISKTILAYKEVAKQIELLKPDTIVLTSPHAIMYADYFHISPGVSSEGDFGQFGAKNIRIHVSYDYEFVEKLAETLNVEEFDGGTLGECERKLDHATMVPLYFVNQKYKNYKLVRIGLSGQSLLQHYELGKYIKRISEEMKRRVVFLASGDLSHKLLESGPYGYQAEGPLYDKKIMKIMKSANFIELLKFDRNFCEKAAECGHKSFVIMAGALDQTKIIAKELSYEGPFGVGYGICSYLVDGVDENRNFGDKYKNEYRKITTDNILNEDAYVKLARKAIETYVLKKIVVDVPKDISDEMILKQAGTFVSIKKDGLLRGCIGTISATKETLAEEIIHNAISAAIYDPRFQAVRKAELSDLVYSVDVLGDIEAITSKEELDVNKYGVIVTKGHRRGLLLPNLEGIDTVEEQIRIAKEKAEIKTEEKVSLERFEVIRHI